MASRQAAHDASLEEIRAALQCAARVTASVAARNASFPWTDFPSLLRAQYGVTEADLAVFTDILAGRTP